MIRLNLRDFDTGNFNGTLVVARDGNFDNMGGEHNDLVPDIDEDHGFPWAGINPDELIQTLQNFPDICQQDSFANDEIVCENVQN